MPRHFDFRFGTLKKTLVTVHGHLKALVGELPLKEVPRQKNRTAGPGPALLQGSSMSRHQDPSTRRLLHLKRAGVGARNTYETRTKIQAGADACQKILE